MEARSLRSRATIPLKRLPARGACREGVLILNATIEADALVAVTT